jgi:hypothetical protein
MDAKPELRESTLEVSLSAARRRFLATCSKFAVVTPPAITLLLCASHRTYADAASGGTIFHSAEIRTLPS